MDSNNEINLRSLKRFDPSVDQILSSASQVAVYGYSNNEWIKLDIEGALFVVSKNGSSNYALIIMNRLNTNNFNEIIDKQWEVTLNLPFLLYKNDKSSIRCVWFYDQIDCKRVFQKLREIVSKNVFDVPKLNNNDSSSIGSKPLEETLAKLGIKQKQQQQTTKNNDTNEFLRSLIQQKNNQKLNLIPNNNLETKEIQSPNERLPVTPGTLTRTLNVEELLGLTSKPSVISNLSNNFMNIENKTPVKSKLLIDNDSDLVLTPALLKQNGNSVKTNDERALSPPILSSQPQEQLYRPTPTTHLNSVNDFISPFQSTRSTLNNQPNVLTMEQLKQTMIYLLQNDADFLHTIHSCYKQNVQSKF